MHIKNLVEELNSLISEVNWPGDGPKKSPKTKKASTAEPGHEYLQEPDAPEIHHHVTPAHHEKAQKASELANKATQSVKPKSAVGHMQAATAHRVAASFHKKIGDHETASSHAAQADLHHQAAKSLAGVQVKTHKHLGPGEHDVDLGGLDDGPKSHAHTSHDLSKIKPAAFRPHQHPKGVFDTPLAARDPLHSPQKGPVEPEFEPDTSKGLFHKDNTGDLRKYHKYSPKYEWHPKLWKGQDSAEKVTGDLHKAFTGDPNVAHTAHQARIQHQWGKELKDLHPELHKLGHAANLASAEANKSNDPEHHAAAAAAHKKLASIMAKSGRLGLAKYHQDAHKYHRNPDSGAAPVSSLSKPGKQSTNTGSEPKMKPASKTTTKKKKTSKVKKTKTDYTKNLPSPKSEPQTDYLKDLPESAEGVSGPTDGGSLTVTGAGEPAPTTTSATPPDLAKASNSAIQASTVCANTPNCPESQHVYAGLLHGIACSLAGFYKDEKRKKYHKKQESFHKKEAGKAGKDKPKT